MKPYIVIEISDFGWIALGYGDVRVHDGVLTFKPHDGSQKTRYDMAIVESVAFCSNRDIGQQRITQQPVQESL